MTNRIKFKMVAYTDAAGKFSADAPRNGNEDNFFFAYDLSKDAPSKGEPDTDTLLSDCGLLMVVADGMGGMNAGEVASQIAVDTVSDFFAPGKITVELAKDYQKRKKYMEQVIGEADIRIKKDAKLNAEHMGMGSTIIMAWIVGDELTLSWCGDSRAYRYNPVGGIELLSKDHSYVQELADKGIIKYEDTFDHPQGNIITRSLGDVTQKAIPETALFKIYNNDIILLCSDGLSGVLRDKKTYDADGELIEGENLEDIISVNRDSLKKCREALWIAAEKADWYDNVTVVLCEIKSGAGTYLPIHKNEIHSKIHNSNFNDIGKAKGINIRLSAKSISFCFIGLLIIVGMSFFTAWKIFSNKQLQNETAIDSTSIGNLNNVQPTNYNLNFVNAQTNLQKRTANIQMELGLQSNDSNIIKLINLITTAKDTIELSNAEHEIKLLEEKMTFLKQIKEKIKGASSSTIKDSLSKLYNEIFLSEKIKKNNWTEQIDKILKSEPTSGSEVGNLAESGDEELTEIVDLKDTIIHKATILKNNTYESLINFLEREKYPGYYVSIVKEETTGRTLFNKKISTRNH